MIRRVLVLGLIAEAAIAAIMLSPDPPPDAWIALRIPWAAWGWIMPAAGLAALRDSE